MKISRLLELHDKYSSLGLSGSFGDGYLVSQNRVFRLVRERVLSGGYSFSNHRHEAYEAFPLLQLESILTTKVLPYTNNVIPFKNLAPEQLDLISWADVDGNLKRNFVFHEGAHALFRLLRPTEIPTDISLRVLWMLLEESFANTMELLGVVDAGDATHRIFYELNSYVCEFEHRSNLKKALEEMGEKVLIPFMVLSYLHANFLREKIHDQDFKAIFKILQLENLTEAQSKTLRALSKIVFNLSERFRYQTTDFHLRLAGVKAPYDLLQKTDFLRICVVDADILAMLAKVSALQFSS